MELAPRITGRTSSPDLSTRGTMPTSKAVAVDQRAEANRKTSSRTQRLTLSRTPHLGVIAKPPTTLRTENKTRMSRKAPNSTYSILCRELICLMIIGAGKQSVLRTAFVFRAYPVSVSVKFTIAQNLFMRSRFVANICSPGQRA